MIFIAYGFSLNTVHHECDMTLMQQPKKQLTERRRFPLSSSYSTKTLLTVAAKSAYDSGRLKYARRSSGTLIFACLNWLCFSGVHLTNNVRMCSNDTISIRCGPSTLSIAAKSPYKFTSNFYENLECIVT